MLMKNIKPLAEPSWVSFCSVIENLDVCFSFPLIAYTGIFRSRTATIFLTVCIVPLLSTSLSPVCTQSVFSLWTTVLHVIACLSKANHVISLRSLCQYLFSTSQMFFCTLTQRLVFTFLLGGQTCL